MLNKVIVMNKWKVQILNKLCERETILWVNAESIWIFIKIDLHKKEDILLLDFISFTIFSENNQYNILIYSHIAIATWRGALLAEL